MANELFPVPAPWAKSAYCDNDTYLKMYQQSVSDPEGFWVSRPNGWIGSSPGPK